MKHPILALALGSLVLAHAVHASDAAHSRPPIGTPALEDAMRAHPSAPDVAVSGPLGSRGNPVRVNGPRGQRDYLSRLRCSDGKGPQYERNGSIGLGPYGRMLDSYAVQCGGQSPIEVVMDMYHCEEETRPLEGFDITERSQPLQPFFECPAN